MKVHPARFGSWSEQKTSRSLAGDCLENYSNNCSFFYSFNHLKNIPEINLNYDTI